MTRDEALASLQNRQQPRSPIVITPWMKALGAVSAAAGAYHGYKRNKGSYTWAILWSMGMGLMPFILGPVAFAQGFGKVKK